MPNAPRRSDASPRQEWMQDISNNGQPSGDFALEVAFDNDDENGNWTTHRLRSQNSTFPGRLSRGEATSIMITGLSEEREREITKLIHQHLYTENDNQPIERGVTNQRALILAALSTDNRLKWTA